MEEYPTNEMHGFFQSQKIFDEMDRVEWDGKINRDRKPVGTIKEERPEGFEVTVVWLRKNFGPKRRGSKVCEPYVMIAKAQYDKKLTEKPGVVVGQMMVPAKNLPALIDLLTKACEQ